MPNNLFVFALVLLWPQGMLQTTALHLSWLLDQNLAPIQKASENHWLKTPFLEKQKWHCSAAKAATQRMWSNDVELADGGLLLATVLVKPLPAGGPGQGGAVLRLATVRLRGPAVGRVPVFECNAYAGLVHPSAFSHHVVGAQPDLLVWANALADVVSELVVLITGRGRAEDAAQVVAVFTGGVVALPHRVSQVALAVDLFAFQTDWEERWKRGMRSDGAVIVNLCRFEIKQVSISENFPVIMWFKKSPGVFWKLDTLEFCFLYWRFLDLQEQLDIISWAEQKVMWGVPRVVQIKLCTSKATHASHLSSCLGKAVDYRQSYLVPRTM